MHEVAPNLYVGTETDLASTANVQSDWAVVYVRCEPENGQAPEVCSEHGEPGDGGTVIIVDTAGSADSAKESVDKAGSADSAKESVDKALLCIGHQLLDGKNVLLCSRRSANCAAGLALLYLAVSAQLPRESLEDAEKAFNGMYPSCEVAAGFREFLLQNWLSYMDATPSPLAHERLPY